MALLPRAPLTKEILYFCDESSFLREETMAVAGLAVPRTNIKGISKRISAIPDGGHRDEVKWQTTRDWNLEYRKAYVDLLAKLIEERLAHFHIRFAQFSAYRHDGPRKRFDTTSKMFYQLLQHRAVRHYGGEFRLSSDQTMGTARRSWKSLRDRSRLKACSNTTLIQTALLTSFA
jgi:hypothetical protein